MHPPSLTKVFVVRFMGSQVLKTFFRRTLKNLIRLGGCPGWSESSLGAQVTLFVLSCCGTNIFSMYFQVAVIELLNCVARRHSCYSGADLYYCVKGYSIFLVGFVIDQLFIEAIKNETGSLRPNFIDVCNPEYNKTLCNER